MSGGTIFTGEQCPGGTFCGGTAYTMTPVTTIPILWYTSFFNMTYNHCSCTSICHFCISQKYYSKRRINYHNLIIAKHSTHGIAVSFPFCADSHMEIVTDYQYLYQSDPANSAASTCMICIPQQFILMQFTRG